MGESSSAPQAPDMSGVAAASKEAAELSYKLGQEQLAWAKEQFATNKATTDQVVASALDTQATLNKNAAADRKRYEDVFQPQEDALINDANTYASSGKKDLEVGKAQAAVGAQFDAARDSATRSLESYGVNPASTRFAALDIGTRAQEAAAKAAAGNTAIAQTDATARDLRTQAINIGKGYPAQSLAETSAANTAGNTAASTGLATTASGASTMGTSAQYMGIGNGALNTEASTLNVGYQNQLAQYKADQASSSGIGSALGAIGGIGLSLAGLPGSSVGGSALTKLFAAEGGEVSDPTATPGGAVPVQASPTAGAATDDVQAALTVGEFVIPKDVTSWKGQEFFQKLIEQSRKASQGATAKPSVGMAVPAAPTFQSRPQGAVPVGV